MRKTYRIYSLLIDSAFELLGHNESVATSAPDYKILQSSEAIPYPDETSESALRKPWSVASPALYYLDIDDICTFLVRPEGTISIYMYPESSPEHMLPFLYDTIFSVALAYKDIFTLKASAVQRKSDGQAQLFCAMNNGGKSTLSTVLMHNGYKFISDDRVLLRWDNNQERYLAQCIDPKVELWRTVSRDFMKGPAAKQKLLSHSHVVRPGLLKNYFHVSEEVQLREAIPVSDCFLITLMNDDEPTSATEVSGLAKVRTMLRHVHKHDLIAHLGKSQQEYAFLSKLCQQLNMLAINRAENAPFIDFVHLVVEKMGTDMSAVEKARDERTVE